MEKKHHHCTIMVNISPEEAMKMISRVSEWWITNVEGSTKKINDVFTVSLGTTWKKFKITEILPGKKVVWKITDCHLPWNSDLTEWKDTEIVWEFSGKGGSTTINFTHLGLASLDCGAQCSNAWNSYIKVSLLKLITEGKGL